MPLTDEAQFHEERRTAITSTDFPKILGLSSWGSPRSVWMDKVDPQPQRPMSLPARLGLELEPTVARLFTEDTGLRVQRLRGFYRAADRAHVASHADYRVVGEKALMESKTRRDDNGWGSPGSSVVPVDVWIQCQIEMHCTKTTRCYVGALFGFGDYRTHVLERDDDFIAGALVTADRFWHENVLKGVMPDMIFADLDHLSSEYPKDNEPTLRTATPDVDLLIEKYREARDRRLDASRAEDTLKARLQRFIGDHAGVQGSSGVVTWKTDNPKPQLDNALYEEALVEGALKFGVPAAEIARLRAEAFRTRAPQRTFLWRKS
jgi:predicted phage-related endonuclease